MTVCYPVALERTSDFLCEVASFIYFFWFVWLLLFGIYLALPFDIFNEATKDKLPVALGLWLALVPIPIVLYFVILMFYYLHLITERLWFDLYHRSSRQYHTVYMCYVKWLASFRQVRGRVVAATKHLLMGCVSYCIAIPPFNTLFDRYTIRRRQRSWQRPLTQAGTGIAGHDSHSQYADSCTTSRICSHCSRIIESSRLLSGSRWTIIRREEQHDLQMAVSDLKDSSDGQFCHLCTVLWHSMSTTQQEQAFTLEKKLLVSPPTRSSDVDLETQPLLQETTPKLRLVIRHSSVLISDETTSGRLSLHLFLADVELTGPIIVEEHDTTPCEVLLGRTTESTQCVRLAQRWMHKCDHEHKQCKRLRTSDEEFLPTRLVYIEPLSSEQELQMRLVRSRDLRGKVEYLALSHCWGMTMKQILTAHNEQNLLQRISPDTIARNFQDAGKFARVMGFRYLWIDSLCIVQRCPSHGSGFECNQTSRIDWEHESRQMGKVYAAAACTISACGSADSSGGCFKTRNPLVHHPCNLLVEKTNTGARHRLAVRVSNPQTRANRFQVEVDQSPLSGRAWAFQERMLSHRMIHFGSTMMFFECATLFASEQQPTGIYDGIDVLTSDGSRHKYPDLCRWSDMLTPFLSIPRPEQPQPVYEPFPEQASPPASGPPSPKTVQRGVGKHARMERNARKARRQVYAQRLRDRAEEYRAALQRHEARQAVRDDHARLAHERALARAVAAAPIPNPAYVAPAVMASLAGNSVTGYRGAFEFLKAAAASAHDAPTLQLRDQLRLHQRWFELVAKYTRSALTVPADRPTAVAGIAGAIQGSGDEERLASNEYLAGLWRRHILFDLLWSVEPGETPCKPRPQTYRAPSWSWMSVDGAVSQRLLPFTLANEARECDIDVLADIKDIAVIDKTQSPVTDATAVIDDGWLEIRCVTCPVVDVDTHKAENPISLNLDTGIEVTFIPDFASQEEVLKSWDLVCVPVLRLRRHPVAPGATSVGSGDETTMYGLVLRRLDQQTAGNHERVGSFMLEAKDIRRRKALARVIPANVRRSLVRVV